MKFPRTSFFFPAILSACGMANIFPSFAQQVNILGNTTFVVEANTHVNGISNLEVDNGGAISNSGEVHLTGDWVNNGSGLINSSPGTVTFGGAEVQQISGLVPTTFYHLVIDNPAGIALDTDAFAEGTVDLQDGKVVTGDQRLTLVSDPLAPIQGASADRYIQGNLAVVMPAGNQDVQFEVGDDVYAPFRLTANVTSSGTIVGKAVSGPAVTEDSPVPNAPGMDANARADYHWTTTNEDCTLEASAILFDFGNVPYTGDPASYFIAAYEDFSSWVSYDATLDGTTLSAEAPASLSADWIMGETQPDNVSESGMEIGVQAFPVPASDQMEVVIRSDSPGPFRIRMVGMDGRSHILNTRNGGTGLTRLTLDVKELAAGQYILSVDNGQFSRSLPVLVGLRD